MRQLENRLNVLDGEDFTRFNFEKAILHICKFNVGAALDAINAIADTSSYEWRIKKAFLYSQLAKYG